MLGDRLEIAQELAQAVGLGIFGNVVWNIAQQSLGLILDHSQLEEERRIEHRIGIFLIREDPFFLAAAHTRPTAYGLFGRHGAIFGITDYATEQAVVGRRYPVMVVNRNCGQRRDINAVFHLFGNAGSKFGIEPVDALDKQYRSFVEFHAVATVLPHAEFEVIIRQLDLFAADDSIEVGIKLLEIQRVERLIVIIARLVEGSHFAVDEIIVERDHPRLEQVGHQLHAEALGRRCLAR